MIPFEGYDGEPILNLSRVCGDDPMVRFKRNYSFRICPAYAGMILFPILFHNTNNNLSRVCGDDPSFIYSRNKTF